MTKLAMIFSLTFILPGCSVSEDMIANKELYCSGVYKGIRAVGRVATEVTTGVAIPDVCDSIDEIVKEDTEGKLSET
jgi:hypothetical protein|tara:strand:- start:341 stop:571 length:231 start_codon:yes stop_codon:yes gene_type:complete